MEDDDTPARVIEAERHRMTRDIKAIVASETERLCKSYGIPRSEFERISAEQGTKG